MICSFQLQSETKDEIAALQKESEVPLDQLLESLPKEILEKPAPISSEKDETEKVSTQYDMQTLHIDNFCLKCDNGLANQGWEKRLSLRQVASTLS